MNNHNSDGPSDNDWEDRGELIWNEFDWEKYLRDQDELILRFLAHYEKLAGHAERLDEAARQMGWSPEEWNQDAVNDSDVDSDVEDSPESLDDAEPYTLYKNPVFVATRALFLSLTRAWERLAEQPQRTPQPLALAFLVTLHRSEDQAIQAIHALDFGDYAMTISLLKRALRELNQAMAHLTTPDLEAYSAVVTYRKEAMLRLFDLREIWLRVMNECRDELESPTEPEEEDDDSV